MASTVHVRYHGIVFELDLDAIREAITRRELTDGVTLGQFAEGAGVSRMAIWRLLGGQRVALRTLGRVLSSLELNPDVIVRLSNPSTSRGGANISRLLPAACPDTIDATHDQVEPALTVADDFLWSKTASDILR